MSKQNPNQNSLAGQSDISQLPYQAPGFRLSQQSQSLLACAKRAEKISAALHLVTSLMPDKFQPKSALEANTVSIINDIYMSVTASGDLLAQLLPCVIIKIEQLISLLSVARVNQQISEMNHEVLQTAVFTLQEEIKKTLAKMSLSSAFTNTTSWLEPQLKNDMFNVSLTTPLREQAKPVTQSHHARSRPNSSRPRAQASDQPQGLTLTNSFAESASGVAVSKHARPATSDSNPGISYPVTKQSSPSKSSKEDRRAKVLSTLRQLGEVTIRDLATRITNVSEKTLQRDLAGLIADNLVIKQGDKRWATYRLNGDLVL